MKNIHVIPTDKPSRLAILGMSNTLQLFDKPITFKTFGRSPQNIYITSDEEIKDGDYYLYLKDNKVYQFIRRDHTKLQRLDIQKKIILTDNKDLIKDGIQAITDKFLEWFIKNPSCEEVEIYRSGNHYDGAMEFYEPSFYSTIIPKEEPKQELPQFGTKEFYTFFSDLCDKNLGGKPKQVTMSEAIKQVITDKLKQEKLEEGFEIEKIAMDKLKSKWEHLYTFGYPQKPFPTNYENDLNNVKIGLCEGAKWQQERSYSEEDMKQFALKCVITYTFNKNFISDNFRIPIERNNNNQFEQFKKK